MVIFGLVPVAKIFHGYLADPTSQPKQLIRPDLVCNMLKDVHWGTLFKIHKNYLRSQGCTLKDCLGGDIYAPRMGYERPAVDLRGIVSIDTLIDAVEKVINPVAIPVPTRVEVAAIGMSAPPVSFARSHPLPASSSSTSSVAVARSDASSAASSALAASSVHDATPSDLMLRSYDDILRFRVDHNVLWLDPRTGAALHRKASDYVFIRRY
jgi:hypothetical protein